MLRELLTTYGYLAVAIVSFGDSLGIPLPGEAVLAFAGGLAGAGQLNVFLVWLSAWIAVIVGDGLTFAIGHFGGRPLILKYGSRFGVDEAGYARAQEFFDKWGGPGFVVGRFLPVLRAVLPPMLGATGMSYWRFAPWQMATAAIWAGIGVWLGYAGGGAVKRWGDLAWTYAVRFWPVTLVILGILALAGVVVASRMLAPKRKS